MDDEDDDNFGYSWLSGLRGTSDERKKIETTLVLAASKVTPSQLVAGSSPLYFAALRAAVTRPSMMFAGVLHFMTQCPVVIMKRGFSMRIRDEHPLECQGIQGDTLSALMEEFCAQLDIPLMFVLSIGEPLMALVCFRNPNPEFHLIATAGRRSTYIVGLAQTTVLEFPDLSLTEEIVLEAKSIERCALLTLCCAHHSLSASLALELGKRWRNLPLTPASLVELVSMGSAAIHRTLFTISGNTALCKKLGLLRGTKIPEDRPHVSRVFSGGLVRIGENFGRVIVGTNPRVEQMGSVSEVLVLKNMSQPMNQRMVLLQTPTGAIAMPVSCNHTLKSVLLEFSRAVRYLDALTVPIAGPVPQETCIREAFAGHGMLATKDEPFLFPVLLMNAVEEVGDKVYGELKHLLPDSLTRIIVHYAVPPNMRTSPNIEEEHQATMNRSLAMFEAARGEHVIHLKAADSVDEFYQAFPALSPVKSTCKWPTPFRPRSARRNNSIDVFGVLSSARLLDLPSHSQVPSIASMEKRMLEDGKCTITLETGARVHFPSIFRRFNLGTLRVRKILATFGSGWELLNAVLRNVMLHLINDFDPSRVFFELTTGHLRSDQFQHFQINNIFKQPEWLQDPLHLCSPKILPKLKLHLSILPRCPSPKNLGNTLLDEMRAKLAKMHIHNAIKHGTLSNHGAPNGFTFQKMEVSDVFQPMDETELVQILENPHHLSPKTLRVRAFPDEIAFLRPLLDVNRKAMTNFKPMVNLLKDAEKHDDPSIRFLERYADVTRHPILNLLGDRPTPPSLELRVTPDPKKNFDTGNILHVPLQAHVHSFPGDAGSEDIKRITCKMFLDGAKDVTTALTGQPDLKVRFAGPREYFSQFSLNPPDQFINAFIQKHNIALDQDLTMDMLFGQVDPQSSPLIMDLLASPKCLAAISEKHGPGEFQLSLPHRLSLTGLLIMLQLKLELCGCRECMKILRTFYQRAQYNAFHFPDGELEYRALLEFERSIVMRDGHVHVEVPHPEEKLPSAIQAYQNDLGQDLLMKWDQRVCLNTSFAPGFHTLTDNLLFKFESNLPLSRMHVMGKHCLRLHDTFTVTFQEHPKRSKKRLKSGGKHQVIVVSDSDDSDEEPLADLLTKTRKRKRC